MWRLINILIKLLYVSDLAPSSHKIDQAETVFMREFFPIRGKFFPISAEKETPFLLCLVIVGSSMKINLGKFDRLA
jgi:hypothetical protein